MAPSAPRRRTGAAGKRAPQPSIRRLLIADALRSWVPPTAAIAVLAVAMLLDATELVPDGIAATISVVAVLVLAVFLAIAPLVADEHRGRVPPLVPVAAGAVATVLLAYPVIVRLLPGTPLREIALDAGAKGAAVVTPDEASRIDFVVDARLPLSTDRRDRTLHYDIDLVDDAGTHDHVSGEVGDSWRMRRLGRRGSAPSHLEHLSASNAVAVGSGGLRIADVTLTGEPRATASAIVYRRRTPPSPVLYVGAALLVLGALVFDLWWDPAAGSTTTMVTASACAAVLVFAAGGAGHPGIRDVIGAVLVGTLVGAPVGGAAAWLARLVSLPGSRRRA